MHRIEYEGLHLVCFQCGKYGHHMHHCAMTGSENKTVEENKSLRPGTETPAVGESTPVGGEGGDTQNGVFGPRLIVKRDFSRKLNAANSKGSQLGSIPRKMEKNKELTKQQIEQRSGNGIGSLNTSMNAESGLIKGEGRTFGKEIGNVKEKQWVPVGAKRKPGIKSRSRGKENSKGKKIALKESMLSDGFIGEKTKNIFSANPFCILESGLEEMSRPNVVGFGGEELLANEETQKGLMEVDRENVSALGV